VAGNFPGWNAAGRGIGLFVLRAGYAAPGLGQPAAATLTIGMGAALSGPSANLGWRQANSVQLLVDQVNAAGGLKFGGKTYTLNLVTTDSQCDSAQAVTAANSLVAAGAVAVIGHTCGVESLAAQPIYNAAGIPMISPSSTIPDVTEQGFDTTFRVISRDDRPPALLARQMRRLDIRRAAIVDLKVVDPLANDVLEAVFTNYGGEIILRLTADTTNDFAGVLAAIQDERPQVIFYSDPNGTRAGLLSRIAYDLGMRNIPIAWCTFGLNRGVLNDYLAEAGNAAAGDYACFYYRSAAYMPGYASFNADYEAAGFPNYGGEATAYGAFAYDTAGIVVDAIRRAKSIEPDQIRQAIAATPGYSGVVGAYLGFDAKGDVIPQWAWVETRKDDQWILFDLEETFLPSIRRDPGP
jgi:branched-chain amino acid transport system substrate-binding protein